MGIFKDYWKRRKERAAFLNIAREKARVVYRQEYSKELANKAKRDARGDVNKPGFLQNFVSNMQRMAAKPSRRVPQRRGPAKPRRRFPQRSFNNQSMGDFFGL